MKKELKWRKHDSDGQYHCYVLTWCYNTRLSEAIALCDKTAKFLGKHDIYIPQFGPLPKFFLERPDYKKIKVCSKCINEFAII